MKIICSCLGLSIIGSLLMSASFAREPFVLKDSLDILAADQLKQTNGIGFFIGVNENGVESVYYYGSAEPDKVVVPETGSLFELGPLSATFTCILFSEMSVSGDIRADAPLQKYLPFDIPAPVYQKVLCRPVKDADQTYGVKDESGVKFTPYVCLPDPDSKPQPILLCYLATHTSGLPPLPFNVQPGKSASVPYESYLKNDLYAFLKSYHLLEPIGYDYHYSELGISILGHVLSLHSQTSFDTLMKSRILMPLNMTSTFFPGENTPDNPRLNGFTTSLKKVKWRNYDVFAPAGGMLSSISDMMKFLSANIGTRNSMLKNVLDYSHNPRILINDSENQNREIALGWEVSKINDKSENIVWQGGSTEGFSSFLGFNEITKSGVVVLSNSNESVESLGIRILELMSSHQ